MLRRWWVIALVVLGLVAGGGYAGYRWYFSSPVVESVAPPSIVDNNGGLPTPEQFAELAKTDPVAMLKACVTRYEREVNGFRAVLEKQERLENKLHPSEVVYMAIREKPVAVTIRWKEGARPDFFGAKTEGVVYPAGEKNDEIALWRPAARLMKEPKVGPKSRPARESSRYCIIDAGFLPTLLRTYRAWEANQKAGELKFVYHGLKPVSQLGGRTCHVIERTCPRREVDSFSLDEVAPTDPKKVESEGFDRVTIMIDAETWIQVGSELKRANGELIGSYYFRDIELNPKFADDEFTPAAIKKAP